MYPSLWQILIVLGIFLLLFGHKRIREFGKSLGEALRDFKNGLDGTDTSENNQTLSSKENGANPQTTSSSSSTTTSSEKTK